jgi:DNA-binding IclR family transcriptional regulator
MMRSREVTLEDVAAGLGWDETTAHLMLTSLVAEGYVSRVETPETTRYLIRLSPLRVRGSKSEFWQRLEEKSRD